MKRFFLLLMLFAFMCLTNARCGAYGNRDLAGAAGIVRDVGNADAALILSEGHAMLIDGGNKSDSQLLYSVLKKEKIRSLDIVVATHAHVDHIGGIPGALNYASADLVLSPVEKHSSEAFDDLKKYSIKNGPGLAIPSIGDTYTFSDAVITILALNSGKTVNETSIVLKIQHGDVSFLFL